MTQEDRQLLLKDLCARVPYDTVVKVSGLGDVYLASVDWWEEVGVKDYTNTLYPLDDVKPYLRPMSSMTEEEKEEFRKLSDEVVGSYGPYHREFIAHCVRLGIKPDNPHECIDEYVDMGAIDWLNAHHFDYRGLIEKGFALEAKEGIYKTE